jgi:heme/copper-type cytochrome/quinol oxidase subunit 2
MFTVDVPPAPCGMVSVAGLAASVNPPAAAALTVNWNAVVLSAWPVAVPFTVTVAVPVVAFAAAVRVSADELPVRFADRTPL